MKSYAQLQRMMMAAAPTTHSRSELSQIAQEEGTRTPIATGFESNSADGAGGERSPGC